MLGYADKEKADLKAKVDKIKQQKGGFLGLFKGWEDLERVKKNRDHFFTKIEPYFFGIYTLKQLPN